MRKPASRASDSISSGMKQLMNGVPFAAAPAIARSMPGRTSGSAISTGSENDMTSVDPAASAATWRNVAATASLVRYMLTPVEATSAGRRVEAHEAGAGHDRRTEGCRERAHVRTALPAVAGRNQLQSDFVDEHVWRCICLYVQRPPQGDTHGRLIRLRRSWVVGTFAL